MTLRPARRRFLLRTAGLAAAMPLLARAPLAAGDFGLVPDLLADQTTELQAAMRAAVAESRPLRLPPGRIQVRGLELPDGLVLEGVRGLSVLANWGDGVIATSRDARTLTISDVIFSRGAGAVPADRGLLEIHGGFGVSLYRCSFLHGEGSGVFATGSQIAISDCDFSGLGDAAIHSMDGHGLTITFCRIRDCGNAGIRIWRSRIGDDPSIVAHNRIGDIDWRGGGNGQNGNGVNVFRADGVIVSDNRISDCAFSAVRLNGTRNAQVSGNICLDSGEVAIFSEFDFSGSIVANNVVDGAATGISITNLDVGGQLAVCTGNIVRNIAPGSAVNPDSVPVGIFAEAETVVSSNTVHAVPGLGIGAGYGPYLRNVVISSNIVSEVMVGIGVSVVEGAGAVHIADNLVSGAARAAIAGMRWLDISEPDLVANAARHPNVSLGANRVVNP